MSAALYGEVTPKKTNAVCLNVATLLEPVLSGSITGPKGEVVLNEMTIANEDVGAPGGVTTSDFALTALIPTEKPNTPPSQKPPVTPTPPTPTPPTPTPPPTGSLP